MPCCSLLACFIYADPFIDAFDCSSTEQRFMEASVAYARGKPILSDVEYDDLKAQLRKKNSKVVQQVIAGTVRMPPAPLHRSSLLTTRSRPGAKVQPPQPKHVQRLQSRLH